MQPTDAVLAFGRHDTASGDRVIVLANRDDQPRDADIAAPAGWPAAARDLLTGETVATADGRLKATLSPKTVRLLVPQP